jgi:hypothetical protein
VQSSKARLLFGALALLGHVGCRASVQGDASAQVTAEETDAELDAELRRERASEGEAPGDAGVQALVLEQSTEGPLLGARHDLVLSTDRATLSCSCLKLALGGPGDGAFRWKGTPPSINSETQLVVGLSSEGMTCKQPKGSLGASYWGYRQSGNDVVVFVESAVKGRPLTTGAIIPKPFGDGQVYAAPAFRGEPYGRGPNGEPRCKLGNPGSPRSSPPPPGQGAEE